MDRLLRCHFHCLRSVIHCFSRFILSWRPNSFSSFSIWRLKAIEINNRISSQSSTEIKLLIVLSKATTSDEFHAQGTHFEKSQLCLILFIPGALERWECQLSRTVNHFSIGQAVLKRQPKECRHIEKIVKMQKSRFTCGMWKSRKKKR